MGITLEEPKPVVIAVPPETLIEELRVTTTAAAADLTPTEGKRIRVLGIFMSLTVTSALTSTVRATIAFGTDHTTESDRILASFRAVKGDDARSEWMGGINVLGAVDEVVRLTNITFSGGTAITRAVIYYREE